MPDKNILSKAFSDMKTLMQYLYAGNTVIIHNSIGTPLKISMDENLNCWCSNMNFPEHKPFAWNENMSPSGMLGVIEAMKNEPPTIEGCKFNNLWEEVNMMTRASMAFNDIEIKDRHLPEDDIEH